MRFKPIAIALLTISMASCDNDMEQIISSQTSEMAEETTSLSRSSELTFADSLGELILYEPSPEELESLLKVNQVKKSLSRIASENTDRFFYSNLKAITGLPFNISVYSIC